jgi:hypothetical protein
MSNARTTTTHIEVFERQKVKYTKKSFLIFSWYVKESVEKLGRDIVIDTNDNIDDVYFNGKKLTPPVQE